MKRIIVCGGRDYDDPERASVILSRVWTKHPDAELVEGGARGADRLARNWAIAYGVPYRTVNAEWDTYGKAAGYRRNLEMAELPGVFGVVAFPGGKGTQHMKDIAESKQIPVLEVTDGD